MTDELCKNYRDDMLSHVEGALDGPSLAALTGHLVSCASCRAEFEVLRTLQGDLEALASRSARHAPEVDLLGAVMDGVRRTKHERRVIPFESAAPRRRFAFAAWMSMGAAAAVLALWFAGYHFTREPSDTSLSRQAQVTDKAPTGADNKIAKNPQGKSVPPSKAKFDEIKRLLANESSLLPQGEAAASNDAKTPDFEEISVTDILALRRSAASDADPEAKQEARARLAAWASLTEDSARELAGSDKASLEAKVGAAQALPAAEAERILLAAVEASPEDPYLRGELAKAYQAQPEKQAEATAQAREQSLLDPENAVNQYKLASSLMRQGDIEGATAALDRAKVLESVNTYSAESDASRGQALEASGMSSSAARALTALTAGMNQYTDLVELATSLLEQGQQAEEQGDYSFAKQVYESVRVMGSQVSNASLLSNERMAGLDIQSSAIDSLFRLFDLEGTSEGMQALTEQVNQLAQAYDDIVKFFEGINAFFSGDVTQNVLGLVTDFIMQYGDLNLVDYIANFSNASGAAPATSAATP